MVNGISSKDSQAIMKNFYENTLNNLELEINDLEIESHNSIQAIESIIHLIIKRIVEVKEYVLKNNFKSIDEEINFFKYQKPILVSKLIYHNTLYKIETKKPHGTTTIRRYLNDELQKLKIYFDNNLDFYKYYRTNSTYLDHKYFVRGKHDIKLSLDNYYFEADHRFSTSHCFKVANIMANDLLQVHLENELNENSQKRVIDNSSLTWTSSKRALTELIYALHSYGVFDNGSADIKVIAKTLERTFNVDLGNFYHTYLEVKSRKINRTKFLDNLREALIKKMDEQEEN